MVDMWLVRFQLTVWYRLPVERSMVTALFRARRRVVQAIVLVTLAGLLTSSLVGVAATGAVAATPTSYVVQAGDTVTGIAARFGVTPSALVSANHLVNPDDILI